jgi:hypothetical protein
VTPPEQGTPSARSRWPVRLEVGLLATLGAVLALRAGGIAREHLRPVALYLAVAIAMLLAFLAALRVERRHVRRLAATSVPLGVRFTKPLWMELSGVTLVLTLGSIAASALAAVGLPGVGAGALLAFALIAAGFPYFTITMWPRGLTFQSDGLHVHAWRATFFVPWTSVRAVDQIGPDHTQTVVLTVAAPDEIVAKAEPDRPRTRERVAWFVDAAKGPVGRVTLWSGTAGLSGPTIARAIRGALIGDGGKVN